MLSPLDDYPVHQIAEPIRHVGTSDRNFYDRYYFNLHHRDDDLFLTVGLGQYPNLGIADTYVAATRGGVQRVMRSSRHMGDDRLDTSVGPFSIEVIEGLRRLRLRAVPGPEDQGELSLDVTWTSFVPAFLEPRDVKRHGPRITTDSCRFCQTGVWEGELRIGSETFSVVPDEWGGGRDRSWGIRPVGDPEPSNWYRAGRSDGFFWIYTTMQFEDFTIFCIVQEDRTGQRILDQAVRLWPEGSGRDPESLGSVEHDLTFVEGTRRVERAMLTIGADTARPLKITVEPITASYLSLGAGYGNDPDWRHGMDQGPLVTQHRAYDLKDPGVMQRAYGLIDSLAVFTIDDRVGHGLFETAMLGPHDRYGFAARSRPGEAL